MKNSIVTVTLGEIVFEVHGTHIPYTSPTHEEPGSSEDFEIDKIFYKDIDVTELLMEFAPENIYRIEEKLINN